MKINKLPKLKDLEIVPFTSENVKIFSKYYPEGVQAGFPSPADDYKENRLSLDAKYLNNSDATYLVKVKGNSMFPTLMIDDLLIIKSDLNLEDNQIAIISVNNTDFTVKRFDKKKNYLIADNEDFPNIKIEQDDTIVLLGVVKHFLRDL